MSSFSLEPLRWLLHPVALLAFAAAAQAWIDGATVRGIVVAVLGVLVAAATEAARQRVVPAVKVSAASRGERGYGVVELVIVVLVILILVFVLLRVA